MPCPAFLTTILRLITATAFLVCATLPAATHAQEGAASAVQPAPADALLDVLQDPDSLAALIAELERIAAAGPDGVADLAAPPADAPLSFSRRVAAVTQDAAEATADRVAALWSALRTAPAAFEGLSGQELRVLATALTDLFLIIACTIAAFIILRLLAIPVYRRMGQRVRGAALTRKAVIFAGSGIIDIVVVVAAWAIGYAVALAALGQFGQIGIQQTLYLNAFLAVELVKAGSRLILSPSTKDLRIVQLDDRAARYVSRAVGIIVSILGYGQLLIVPIINANASLAAGRGASVLISLAVTLYLVFLVLRNRAAVTQWLLDQTRPAAPVAGAEGEGTVIVDASASVHDDADAIVGPAAQTVAQPAEDHVEQSGPVPVGDAGDAAPSPGTPRRRGAFVALAQIWHWLALAYLAIVFLMVLVRPGAAVVSMLTGSIKIAAALFAGLILSGLLAQVISRGVRLPAGTNARLPLLESRINRFVPQTLLVLRVLIAAAVVLFALHTLGAVNVSAWLEGQFGRQVATTIVSVALILLMSFIAWLALTSWIDYRLNPDFGNIANAREETLLTLLRNAATIALIVVTLMFVLAEIGLNIGPLLASAGVLGLAIGFGAQKMVQDIITGVFIQFENAINVGDVVTAGSTTGVVERLTVRSVSLRDVSGVFHIIPFSSVDMVSNFTRDFSYYVCDMGVAYREDISEVKQAMFDAFDDLRADAEQAPLLIGELEWFGLNSFGDSAIMLRARIKTLPGKQWGVGRAYNEIVKRIFDARNIEIPFPHQTIYFGEAKDGRTQPVHLVDDTAKSGKVPENTQ